MALWSIVITAAARLQFVRGVRVWLQEEGACAVRCGAVWFGYSGLIKMRVGNANINLTISDVQLRLRLTPCARMNVMAALRCQEAGQTGESRQETNHQRHASNVGACQRKRK